MLQQRGNQQAANAAIAIQEGVNRLKLQVNHCRLHQRRQWLRSIMDKPFQVRQQGGHPLGRGRHKNRIAGARAPNPVLRAAQLAGLFAIAPHAVQQQAVGIA